MQTRILAQSRNLVKSKRDSSCNSRFKSQDYFIISSEKLMQCKHDSRAKQTFRVKQAFCANHDSSAKHDFRGKQDSGTVGPIQ